MQIANPIYDVVFKYLMDDNKVAKLLLSAIIGEEIVDLEYRPTEMKTDLTAKSITVYHIDFGAKIRSEDGTEKLVIIEIQKAKLATDIMRFRKYLGAQYSNMDNVQEVKDPITNYKKAIPIISIYFLGHKLDHIKVPVIKVQRDYIDLSTGDTIIEKEYFIESLTHDSFIIQIPYLKDNRKTGLLKVLSIFDQSNREQDFHILNVDEKEFPGKYRDIIRRLQQANSDSDVRQQMGVEDIYIEDFRQTERYIEMMKETIEENKKTIEESKKTIEEKVKLIEDNNKLIEDKDKLIEDKDKLIEELKKQLKSNT
ncbi:MAG: hypothetical protein A2309_08135 [Bacteroidetes bacterium RIFOXYB2_FULL_35_7]|nr:MAG: hypothetical protein A2X01_20530 [Bacteroidetes bacterium GWF2_35_48]OFY96499.1 MAG: hypothetical protein A2309_08135 [Bacteroidetes bacterium RIFOXYB2_FULL_35_7]HBX50274.1 hypothetical protein [Bacteroidales bacterium]